MVERCHSPSDHPSRFQGLHWRPERRKWQLKLRYTNASGRHDYHFGYFEEWEEEKAARIWDVMALELWGTDRELNFDGLPPAGMSRAEVLGKLRSKLEEKGLVE